VLNVGRVNTFLNRFSTKKVSGLSGLKGLSRQEGGGKYYDLSELFY